MRGDFVNQWENNMEYIIVHGSTFGYFVINSLNLEHNM